LKNEGTLVFSYLRLRKIAGFLGMAFPFVMWLGGWSFYGKGIQSSISAYYHTPMQDFFVGILWAIGFFLLSCKGYDDDYIFGATACGFAVGVSLFPVTPDGVTQGDPVIIGALHQTFAALFFITLIYFSGVLFTKTHESKRKEPTPRKLLRNKVYLTCAWIMAFCVVSIPVYNYLLPPDLHSLLAEYEPVFWLESLAIFTFGVAWATKGEAIAFFNDEE